MFLTSSAGRDLQNEFKPVRDTSAANRMIGAALGIRLPKPQPSSNSGAIKTPSKLPPDFWEDG